MYSGNTRQPYYVWSGDLKVKIIGDNAFDAAKRAFDAFSGYKVLDPDWVYVGQKGFDSAGLDRFPLDKVLEAIGFEFEDDGI